MGVRKIPDLSGSQLTGTHRPDISLVTVKAQEEQVFKANVAKYPQFQTAIDQLHDSSADYVGALLSVFPEARATVESEIESMLNGKEDVDTAVKNMADSINKSIEEYNLVNE